MDAQIEETRRKLEESLYYLGMIQAVPAPVFKQVADQNWMDAWKQHYKPIPIGRRLMILPAWLESPEPDRIAIKIDPGMAFGTGTHPTTQLCLELLEMFLDDRSQIFNRKSKIIDVGCGSGILSIAAIKLGVKTALGVDIDAGSIVNSRENANVNGIGDELILGVGSVQDILSDKFPFKRAPFVVANILAPVIIRLFDIGLAELMEDDGVTILSGILQEQAESVIETAQARSLRLNELRQMGDWVALVMSRSN
jgi:ribosomal protein L11 methyltransferase